MPDSSSESFFWSHSGGTLPIEVASAPAVAGSANAQVIHVLARHTDQRFMHTRLVGGSVQWSPWASVGAGLFTSAPAVACLGAGQRVFVFGSGTDNGIWWNYSLNAGTNWVGWATIGQGAVFSAVLSLIQEENGL